MNNGAFGENFPYSNFHDLNMDWIIKIAKDFLDQYTHIQEVISTGEQNLQDLTTDGLAQLQTKADALEKLLQEWYNTHSTDIANQLANALDDLNNWYNTHQGYLDQYLTDSITAFNQAAEQKAQQTIASIPADYTTLSNDVTDLKSSFNWVARGKNLCGMNPDVFYPVCIDGSVYLTMSTSDGSNMQYSQFYLYVYDENFERINYYTFTQGESSKTISTESSYKIRYIRWSRAYPYANLQVELGQTATAYEEYWGNAKWEHEEIESLFAADEKFEKFFDYESTVNLFDDNFDSSGYINVSTGADTYGSSYKRTTKYYPFNPLTKSLFVKLSASTPTFCVLFYDDNQNYLYAYTQVENVTSAVINDIPADAAYFRIYTDSAYNSDCIISYAEQSSFIEYNPVYVQKSRSIGENNLANDLFKGKNLVKENRIMSKVYMNYAKGSVYNNINDYRTSSKINVKAGTQYALTIFQQDGGNVSTNIAISVAFYGGASYISGIYHSNPQSEPSSYICKNGVITFTTPANTTALRICVNDDNSPLKWQLEETTGTTYSSYHQMIDNITGYKLKGLEGKNVVVFGDSIMGNARDLSSTPSYISKATGANVFNLGFGGCRMSVHATGWDNCSMYRLADDIYNNDFSTLLSAISTGWSGMPGYFTVTAAELAYGIDFTKIDAIVISYGTNDYREPTSVLDNPSNKFDTSTVCGALRYSIKQIQSKYPAIQILVTCPIFRTFFQEGTTTPDEYSDTKDWGSGTLLQYAEAYKQACADMNVPFLDLYHETSFNPYTRLYFYPADDGTHPNEKGRERIGKIIGGRLIELMPSY